MKNDPAGFDNDPSGASSRINGRMMPYGPNPYPDVLAPGTYQYRRNSLSGYPYSVKPYYAVPPFNDYPDETAEYSIQGAAYHLFQPDMMGAANYTPATTVRGWTQTPGPQIPKNSPFLEQSDSAYSHAQLPFSGNFPLRTAIAPDSRSLSINGTGTSLPTPATGNDRVLPFPAANRTSQVGSFLRSVDGLLPVSQNGLQSYNDLMSPGMLNSVKSHNNVAVSESGSLSTGYLPMTSSSPESLASSQMAYTPQSLSLSMSQQSSELYQTSNDGLFPGHPQDSSDSSYGHSSPASKRGSQSSHTTTTEGSLPPLSSGSLANGHEYHWTPQPNPSTSYPLPPVDMQARPRRSISGAVGA